MPRNTQIFEPTFRGRGVLRIDDVTKDPRYGKNAPYRGMPTGHLPVTSYLAVPVTSRSGEVLGGLFFGYREAGVFTKRHERLVEGIAAQAAVAIDNSRLYRAVLEADRKKDEFLAVLAHELRNPLAPITSALQILKLAGHNGPMAVRAREMAERQVQALTRMVDDLLDVSRIMRGKIELRRERIDLTAVVARAVETARPAIDAMRHTLQVSLGTEPVWVAVDVVRMAQVVANLLNNAAKHTDPGGCIQLTVERSEASAVVRVRDNGIGLTVVRNLVEMHGGTVEARSEGPGRGSASRGDAPDAETDNVAGGPARRGGRSAARRRTCCGYDADRSASCPGLRSSPHGACCFPCWVSAAPSARLLADVDGVHAVGRGVEHHVGHGKAGLADLALIRRKRRSRRAIKAGLAIPGALAWRAVQHGRSIGQRRRGAASHKHQEGEALHVGAHHAR